MNAVYFLLVLSAGLLLTQADDAQEVEAEDSPQGADGDEETGEDMEEKEGREGEGGTEGGKEEEGEVKKEGEVEGEVEEGKQEEGGEEKDVEEKDKGKDEKSKDGKGKEGKGKAGVEEGEEEGKEEESDEVKGEGEIGKGEKSKEGLGKEGEGKEGEKGGEGEGKQEEEGEGKEGEGEKGKEGKGKEGVVDIYRRIMNKSFQLKYNTTNATIESVNYPDDASANLTETWTITGESGYKIRLECSDIRLFEETPCGDYVLIFKYNGKEEEKCDTDFDFKKTYDTTQLVMVLKTGNWARGFTACVAWLISDQK